MLKGLVFRTGNEDVKRVGFRTGNEDVPVGPRMISL